MRRWIGFFVCCAAATGLLAAGCTLIVDRKLERKKAEQGADGGADCRAQSDGSPCGAGYICLSGKCEQSICGDGIIDESRGEQCEEVVTFNRPHNYVAEDGCSPRDCIFSCPDGKSALTTWFVDCDGDGFAASDEGKIRSCERPDAPTCVWPWGERSPGNWTPKPPQDAASTDCFDFASSFRPDNDVFLYGAEKYKKLLPFDSNCDGEQEMEGERAGVSLECEPTLPNQSCAERSGWEHAFVPACGELAPFVRCHLEHSTCTRDERVRRSRQGCR